MSKINIIQNLIQYQGSGALEHERNNIDSAGNFDKLTKY